MNDSHIYRMKDPAAPKKTKLTAVILAGTHGSNMKTMGPKCLIKYDGYHTILEHQIASIKQIDNDCEILVVTGFQHKKIHHIVTSLWASKNVRTILNPLYQTTGPAYGFLIGYAAAQQPSNVLIVHGDLIFQTDTLMPMCGGQGSKLLVGKQAEYDEVGITVDNGHISNIAHGLSPAWGQIAYITSGDNAKINKIDLNMCKTWFTHELLVHLIDDGVKFYPIETTNKIMDIDTPKQVKQLSHVHEVKT